MLRLSRAALALLLATWTTAVAAVPPCVEDAGRGGGPPAQLDGDADSHGEEAGGDCDVDCAACSCCRAPVTSPRASGSVEPMLSSARVQLATPAASGAADLGEIFQPPRP